MITEMVNATSGVDPSALNGWLVIAIMPVTSVLTLIINNLFSRRKNQNDQTNASKVARVSEMDVAFDGLTSNLNGLTEQLKDVKSDLKEAKADARRTQDELNTTRSDLRRLETAVSDLRVERLSFLGHISRLEALIPPPGPPARPSWMTDEDPTLRYQRDPDHGENNDDGYPFSSLPSGKG